LLRAVLREGTLVEALFQAPQVLRLLRAVLHYLHDLLPAALLCPEVLRSGPLLRPEVLRSEVL